MDYEELKEDWLDWQDEVPDDVDPALFWYMKGANSQGKLTVVGTRFDEAQERWRNSSGPDGLHSQYPEFIQYASVVFTKRAERRGVPTSAFIPEQARS